jgi:hypothetical protein
MIYSALMATATSPVKLPGLLLNFLERASVGFGCTRTRDRVPQIHWVSGWSADPDGSTVRCFIPELFAAGLADALKDNGRFALTIERIGAHETYQFKGTADSLRPVSDADRAASAACRERFVTALRALGPMFNKPGLDLAGYFVEPAVTVSLRVHEVFLQTPGPGAGARLVPPESRR